MKIIWYPQIETHPGTISRARRHRDSSFHSELLIKNKVKALRLNVGTEEEPQWLYAPTEADDMWINLGKEAEYVLDGTGIATEHDAVISSFPAAVRKVIAFFDHAPLGVMLPQLAVHPTNPGGIYKGPVSSDHFLYNDLAKHRKDVPEQLLRE